MIAQIIADLDTSRRTLRAFQEMNFVLVPIGFVDYPDESDPSPYPIPGNMPVETWPSGTGGLTLQQWQQDINNVGGDRHAIIVQPGSGGLWEMWQAKLVGTAWAASNGARFDLGSNALRPAGWTSADAAGLPMFPALPRYDECERGMVEHACRVVVKRTRRQYIYPATHYASTTPATQTNVPAMGQRLRLKSGFVIPPTWTKAESEALALSVGRAATNLDLCWAGGAPPYVVELRSGSAVAGTLEPLVTTTGQQALVPMAGSGGFLRVRGH